VLVPLGAEGERDDFIVVADGDGPRWRDVRRSGHLASYLSSVCCRPQVLTLCGLNCRFHELMTFRAFGRIRYTILCKLEWIEHKGEASDPNKGGSCRLPKQLFSQNNANGTAKAGTKVCTAIHTCPHPRLFPPVPLLVIEWWSPALRQSTTHKKMIQSLP
jgi:hypothetical protein